MSQIDVAALTQRGNNLLISISGVRGVLPAGLDPINVAHFIRAFAAITGPRIVVGEDARPTGPALKSLILGVLQLAGKEVLDAGLAPTPTIKAAVASARAGGGIMISASHNPLQWNGFKFIQPGGFFFDRAMFERWNAALAAGAFPGADYRKQGSVRKIDAVRDHIQAVLAAIPNLEEIRKRKYAVVIDAVAGAGREALPMLLEEMGCRLIRLYCDATPGGAFPRPPEPTPAALKEFSRLVRARKAAVGFALDPDADRLVCASPGLGAINEEYTAPLAFLGRARYLPRGSVRDGAVVVNLSTANLLAAVVRPLGLRVIQAPVGEANVVAAMIKAKALFGAEGNGGVIDPRIPSYGRDTLIGAALILSAMAASDADTLDALMSGLPSLYMEKTKFPVAKERLPAIFQRMESAGAWSAVDRRDGLHLSRADGAWLHIRTSNTEPIIRVIAQAPAPGELKKLMALARTAVNSR